MAKNDELRRLNNVDDEEVNYNPNRMRHAAGYEDDTDDVYNSTHEQKRPSSTKGETTSSLFSDDDEHIYQLTDDVYSMVFLANTCSAAFVFAMFTFLLKIVIYVFIMIDMLDGANASNPLSVPKGISTLVRAAQFIMLPVAVAIQEDLIASIALFNVKFRRSEEMKQLPGATLCKWILGSICRFIDGILSLIVNFTLLEKSDTVLGLMLNFAALGFLQTIDNVAYHLALEGYLSDSIEAVAKAATVLTLPKYKSSKVWKVLDSLFIVLVYIAILSVWLSFTLQQIEGRFLCQSFSASFTGDEWWLDFNPSIYSGAYDLVGRRKVGGRAIYVERNYRDEESARGIFGYCADEARWAFIVSTKQATMITNDDICNYILASPDGAEGAFDPTETTSSKWMTYSNDAIPQSVPLSFEISCIDCAGASDCSERGQCQNKKCVCNPPYYGSVCDLVAE
uniref:EGF-like domain-containing protein n=1 Tax=Ditylum brightwellii TaxID=49249 RepID=A0A6U3SDT0_9STRA|mmetsp:Transcript_3468/g.5358  ORF Transcript_3468/g.5358 Transcript_3468/m.5358 type:complete len:452 (+) Transcript_3468:178-1533(+)